MKRILIVDDDISIGDLTAEILTREGYEVARAYSGTEAKLYLSGSRPDLILLDLMLPGLPGEQLLPYTDGIPVIVVSAKVDVEDKVSLLYGGAVDYITKPFQTRELSARVAAALRRVGNVGSEGNDGGTLSFGDIRLDPQNRAVTVNGSPVMLTRTEFAILRTLMKNPTQVIAKSRLLDLLCADTPDCTESSLKTHVSHLRSKLRDVCGRDCIESVWGIGYKLNTDE